MGTLSFSLDPTRWRRWRLEARSPRQVAGHQVNEHGRKNQNQAKPESPITMRKFPVGAMPLLGTVPIMIGFVGSMIYFIHGQCCFFHAFTTPADAFRLESAPQFVRGFCPWFRAPTDKKRSTHLSLLRHITRKFLRGPEPRPRSGMSLRPTG